MEHNAPHKSAAFEGYYSKFDLPSGAKLALIICQVKNADKRPNMLSFTYVPRGSKEKVFQRELWVDKLHMVKTGADDSFVLDIPDIGRVIWRGDSTTEYDLETEDFSLHGRTTTRTNWSSATETPEWLLVYLPLPLHWHVHSLASHCDFKMTIPSRHLAPEEESGIANVHQEKNWAHSFPSAHIWLQARDGDRGFCAAGGQILGIEAFLVGYRNKDFELDFRPPFAVRVAGWGPFMSYRNDWDERTFVLSVQSFRHKIEVKASAPKGTFFSLSSPFADGHRENYLGQSFRAILSVQVFESDWFGPWRLLHSDRFEGASLEFGGGYYPPAGSEARSH